MKNIYKNLNRREAVNQKKVMVFMIVGLGFGLCVGYTMGKLAHWFMNLH